MYKKTGFSLQELAERTQCELIGDAHQMVYDVADLENATFEDVSFLANMRYKHLLKETQAGVIFIDRQTDRLDGQTYLISDNPSRSFQQVIDLFHPPRALPSGFTGIHSSAVVHATAQIGQGVTLGPHVVVDEYVIIGDRTFVGSGSYIGPHTLIGQDCVIHPRVVVRENCVVGHRVIIQPGAVIGSCGFGYLTDAKGHHTKLNQVGNVQIEDDVEIGANTTIDRARFKSTVVGNGTKIDNLVQLGHAVKLGSHNLIVSQTGLAGSTSTGENVVLAGQVAVAGHLHLEKGVMVAGKSGVSKSLTAGKYSGIPAMPVAEYNKNSVYLRQIEKYVNQIKQLDQRLKKLENEQGTDTGEKPLHFDQHKELTHS